MYKNIIVVMVFAGLGGCTYSVERLISDDDLRQKIIIECVKKGVKAMDDQNCKLAVEAQLQLTGKAVQNIFK